MLSCATVPMPTTRVALAPSRRETHSTMCAGCRKRLNSPWCDLSHLLASFACVLLNFKECVMSELIDNKANRIRVLKDIIKHLHAGKAPEQVQKQRRELVKQTAASEIMAMEQELIAEGRRGQHTWILLCAAPA